ncbi:MAG: DUF4157 domain-containing protein [Anaerolineae bacterium]|nr:DUF4157 domain-containing protein [Anaerolineae bacterium]
MRVTGLGLSALQRDVLALQRTAGNRAVTGLIQAKLTVGAAGDQYEQEADRVAERVLNMPAPVSQGASDGVRRQEGQEEEEALQAKPLAATITPFVQRQEEEEEIQTKPLVQRQEEEEEVQAMPLQRVAKGSFDPGGEFERRLNSAQSGGLSLPAPLRAEFEPKFGADFSSVRVHTGADAAELNRAVNARAFTHGRDIYMGSGAYAPDTVSGKHLLAHELTHTLQQGAAQHIRGWWPTGHRLVSEMAIKEGGFDQFYDKQVLDYLVDRSPDIDFIQDEATTMNRGIAESKSKIDAYKKLRKDTKTRPQAIEMYNNNEIHYRRPAYMLSHGEAGLYKDDDAAAKNAAVTTRLIGKAVSLWKSYQHAEGMSVLSDALHQAEDRGSHGEGNAFTGHDARLAFNEYEWEKQGVEVFKTRTGQDSIDGWAPDNASVNRKGLVLGVAFGQGVLASFVQQVGATKEKKITFPGSVLQAPPEKRKMSAKWFLPAMSSGASMVGAVGKTATGSTTGEKRRNMALVFKQTIAQEGMADLYKTAKQLPTENVPDEFKGLLEEGMAFYEQGAGLLQNDPTYRKAYREAKDKFEVWNRSRLRKGGLSKSERRQQAKEYYLMEKIKYKGRQRAIVGEAIRKAYQDVFSGDIGVQQENADAYMALGLQAYIEYLKQNPGLISEKEKQLLGII